MRLLFLLPLVILVALRGGPVRAQDQDSDVAVAFGESWLQLIDTGDYANSWKQASPSFRASVAEANWEQQIKAARGAFGLVKSRNLKSVTHNGADYTVVRFVSNFENKPKATEMLSLVRLDGQWRADGYLIR
ncbi:MAG TPA: DUF4019 domain-containing protein [Alphaproteobacteria bacterium]|nr:DUF4019 domain-containing protein [Alphaproteobacteria bacterium]